MAMIKTAISMPKSMFDEVNEAASELEISRSRLIVLALKDFLHQRESARMLAQLNAVYGDDESPEELELLRWAKHHALRRAAMEDEQA